MASATELELYHRGLKHFEAGNLAVAEATFQEFMENYVSSDLADNALYQLGMIYSMTDRRDLALETFRNCVKAYAGSDAAPLAAEQARVLEDEVDLALGRTCQQLFHEGRNLAAKGQFEKAKQLFLRCVEEFPDSGIADNVYLSLSTVYSLEQRFGEARKILELILEKFPGSDAAAMVPAALRRLEQDERYA